MALKTRVWEKDPEDADFRTFDWIALGFLEPGETIVTSNWNVPSGSGLTQPAAASNTTTTTTIWLGGGTLNTEDTMYRVKNTITTSAGRTRIKSWMVYVAEQ